MSIEQINTSLREVGTNLKNYREKTEQAEAELGARLQAVEQLVVKLDHDGSGLRTGGRESVGSSAAAAFAEDAGFQAAADAARRNMKVGRLESRINLDASIRAALVGGTPGSNDTSYPTVPSRRDTVGGLRRLSLLDALPSRPTSSDTFEVVKLTGTGDAEEQDIQGSTKAQIEFAGNLETGYVATIAGWTAASKQVLGDAAALQSQIDVLLRHKVLSKLEDRIINGTGGAGMIDGLLNQGTTFLPTIGTTPADIIGEAMMRQATEGYLAGGAIVVLHPTDWFALTITKSNTEGEYIFGSPIMPVDPRLWNSAVVTSPSVPLGTGITIDPAFVTLLDREQLSVVISNSHADFFVRNLVAILAELRAGLEVLDPTAIYTFDLNVVSS